MNDIKRQALAELLAKGVTITAAAEEVGVHRATAHAWLQDEEYRAQVEALKERAVAPVRDQAVELFDQTAQAFREALDHTRARIREGDPKAPGPEVLAKVLREVGQIVKPQASSHAEREEARAREKASEERIAKLMRQLRRKQVD